MGARRERAPYKVRIKKTGLSNRDVHGFIEDFTDRYSLRMSLGEDLRDLYNFELEAFCEGVKVFLLDMKYINNAGIEMTVRDRKEDYIVIEVEGEFYEAEHWYENGLEYIICSDIVWASDQIYNENEMNEQRSSEEKESV
jgi:hypothetical protein